MPGIHVDGNDPIAMYNAAKTAIDRARNGEGPTLIEAMTFRFYGHVFGDQDGYMDKEEKSKAMADDPIPKFRAWLIEQAYASEKSLTDLEEGFDKQVKEAIASALSAPWPELDELDIDVLAAAQH
jgi:pyruvate dehydrogenase E1 component alpha subunit